MLIEFIATTIEDALLIERSGADRIGHGDWSTRMETLVKIKKSCHDMDVLIGSGLTRDNIHEVHSLVGTGCYHFGTAIRHKNSVHQSVSLDKAVELVSIMRKLAGHNKNM